MVKRLRRQGLHTLAVVKVISSKKSRCWNGTCWIGFRVDIAESTIAMIFSAFRTWADQ